MKRAMKVVLKEIPVESIVNQYDCPSCKTGVRFSIPKQVTRFRCIKCDRELIISSRRKVKYE